MSDDLATRLRRLAPDVDSGAGLAYVHQTATATRHRQRLVLVAAALFVVLLLVASAAVAGPDGAVSVNMANNSEQPSTTAHNGGDPFLPVPATRPDDGSEVRTGPAAPTTLPGAAGTTRPGDTARPDGAGSAGKDRTTDGATDAPDKPTTVLLGPTTVTPGMSPPAAPPDPASPTSSSPTPSSTAPGAPTTVGPVPTSGVPTTTTTTAAPTTTTSPTTLPGNAPPAVELSIITPTDTASRRVGGFIDIKVTVTNVGATPAYYHDDGCGGGVIDLQFQGARPDVTTFPSWDFDPDALAAHLASGGNVSTSWMPAYRPVNPPPFDPNPCQPQTTVRTLAPQASFTETYRWDLGLPPELLNRGDISSNPVGVASVPVYGRPELEAPVYQAQQQFAELILTDTDVSANPLDTAIATVAANPTVRQWLIGSHGRVGVDFRRGNWWFTFYFDDSVSDPRRLIVRFDGNQISDIRTNDFLLGPNDDPGSIGWDQSEHEIFPVLT